MKKPIHLVIACVALGLALSACGSGSSTGNGNPAAVTQQNGEGGAAGGAPGGFPGGSGKVAAVAGSTAQVQGQNGQVAVTWTSSTRFTQQVAASVKDLKVGDCVTAMPAASSTGSSDTSSVAAASVRISAPVSGSCTVGVRGQGGQGGGTRTGQGTPPEGAPSGAPTDGARRGGFGAFGKVTAVRGTGFTVESTRPGATDTSKVSVTTSGDTTWTRSGKTTAKDVKVGSCVASMGKSDNTGAITAATIAVSQPVNGACTTMFGGPGRSNQGDGQAQNS
jgi:hypothetical protein